MVFLTDWSWGHYFAVGNSVIHQWRKGDVITWKNHMHHCGSNSGMVPKMTMNITGVVNKKSVHLNKMKVFNIWLHGTASTMLLLGIIVAAVLFVI